jgi:hypothetical protein
MRTNEIRHLVLSLCMWMLQIIPKYDRLDGSMFCFDDDRSSWLFSNEIDARRRRLFLRHYAFTTTLRFWILNTKWWVNPRGLASRNISEGLQ